MRFAFRLPPSRIRAMDLTVLLVFVVVYLGMMLGEIPGLALDRTGVAVLGASRSSRPRG